MFEFDFFASKNVNLYEKESNSVSHIINKLYKLNSIALLGINASGKTTSLKLVLAMLNIFIKNKSLSEDDIPEIGNYFDDEVICENYIFNQEWIYKIESIISKDKSNSLYFKDEVLYRKKVKKTESKDKIFTNFEETISRKDIDVTYLKQTDSIFSGVLNRKNHQLVEDSVVDLTNITDVNKIQYFANDMDISYVNFLDDSIESLIFEEDTKKFKIRFKYSKELIESNIVDLNRFLSSGTIKGIMILLNIQFILNSGGYLIIDELENHLNKSIAVQLIKLFNSNINKNSATLIFTTHYIEITDFIDRSDSIYVLKKNPLINIEKMSNIIGEKDRSDRKKSDLILSGSYGLGTAPKNSSYKMMRESMNKSIKLLSSESHELMER
ncbi:lantibiotic protection ABC superfamily ATP binding cassette transporter [Streptococcus sanguinis SK115]|uniref:Lantibiotic protection ABC superfamily ATP binding cassette transporter n=1 Tax=Streptococcus sanguinis SK115 TaxID=888810 RepID=F0I6S3_STRSA|nr:lantibiotic protection ABC superfamily ATP binding cassette transporter [Streptococcus sanguinis SK115]